MDADKKKYKKIFNSKKSFQQKLNLAEQYANERIEQKINNFLDIRIVKECGFLPLNLN